MINNVKYCWKNFSIPNLILSRAYFVKISRLPQSRTADPNNDMKHQRVPKNISESGFSLVELVIVVLVIMTMTGISLYYLNNQGKLFKADDQALQIVDVLQEARQRSLTQRETMRVEIDLTSSKVRLIDENDVSVATDDVIIKEVALLPSNSVKLNARPSNITLNPPEPLATTAADFRPSVHPNSLNHNVCTYRFLSNGRVVNAGTTSTGSNAQLKSEVLFIWSPSKTNANEFEVARAITVVGTTGSIRLWQYAPGATTTNKWQDSRRVSSYGGSSTGNSNN